MLVTYRTWFTIFFIPVIPYKSMTVVTCPECGAGFEVTGPELAEMHRMVQLNQRLLSGEVEADEYEQQARALEVGSHSRSALIAGSGEVPSHTAGELANLGVPGKLIRELSSSKRERQVQAMATIAATAGNEATARLRAAIAAWTPIQRAELAAELLSGQFSDREQLLEWLASDDGVDASLTSPAIPDDGLASTPVSGSIEAPPVAKEAGSAPQYSSARDLGRPVVYFGGNRAVLLGGEAPERGVIPDAPQKKTFWTRKRAVLASAVCAIVVLGGGGHIPRLDER
jgi:hypothetical protein